VICHEEELKINFISNEFLKYKANIAGALNISKEGIFRVNTVNMTIVLT
jgi:hypothetical protein